MIYRLLGDLLIVHNDRQLDLPRGHTLQVLVALLVRANRRISQSDLLRAAWGRVDVSPAQLHKHAGYVRECLAEIGRRHDVLTHAGYGYELRVCEDEVDMLVFQRLIRNAEAARARQDADGEIDLLHEALAMWRGQYVMGNVPRDGIRQDAEDVERRRMRAAVRLFDLELARGNYLRTLDSIMKVAAYYPTDRRLCEQLMIAFYKAGHATEALNAYERHAAALAEETGGAPEARLRNLRYSIASGDEAAITDAESFVTAQPAPVVRMIASPKQLPRAPADFVGREALSAEIRWLLGQRDATRPPVVVVSGPGGIGKTALALHVAHMIADRYPDGQLFVELRGTTPHPRETNDVVAELLRGFGVLRLPETLTERLWLYRSIVVDREVLIVLDDAHDEAQVDELIPGGPNTRVLITARRRLPDVDGVHHVASMEPLEHHDAHDLFRRVVRNGGLDGTDDPAEVERLVGLCSGLPLAIRIAGALRVQEALRPIGDLLDRLTSHGPDALAYGENSVARSIGASLDRLPGPARRLFLSLGLVQLPTFELWSAAALLDGDCNAASAALADLGALYMIQPAGQDFQYRFHDLTREYAHRRALVEYPEEADRSNIVRRAYVTLLTLLRRAHRALYGGDFEIVHSAVPDAVIPPDLLSEVESSPEGWFGRQAANVRAAVHHSAELGFADVAWDLAVSSHEFYTILGLHDDWYATHTAALEACRAAGDDRGASVVLVSLGQPALVASMRSGGLSGPDELRQAIASLREAGDHHGLAIALRTLANALRRRGQLHEPLALFEEALANYSDSQDPIGQWQTLRFIGQTHLDLGDHQNALRLLDRAAQSAVALGRPRLVAQSNYWLGEAHIASGNSQQAQAAFAIVKEIFGEGGGLGSAYAAHGLGEVAKARGDAAAALQHYELAGRLAHDASDALLEGRIWLSIADLHPAASHMDERLAALREAVACLSQCDAVYLEAEALYALGLAETQHRDPAAADAAWTRMELLYEQMSLPENDRRRRRPRER